MLSFWSGGRGFLKLIILGSEKVNAWSKQLTYRHQGRRDVVAQIERLQIGRQWRGQQRVRRPGGGGVRGGARVVCRNNSGSHGRLLRGHLAWTRYKSVVGVWNNGLSTKSWSEKAVTKKKHARRFELWLLVTANDEGITRETSAVDFPY